MKIGGFEKYSFIDYPDCIGSVVFTSGCNFHCPYCHNPGLVRPDKHSRQELSDENAIFSFLKKRKKYIDGIVITGGEPTLQADLPEFCRKIRDIGLLVKLDTNGSMPGVIEGLLQRGLVDYVAMDIKTSPDRYNNAICDIDPCVIENSIELLLGSSLPFEFRTTCVKPIVDEDAIQQIAGLVRGAPLYVIQRPQLKKVLDPSFFDQQHRMITEAEIKSFKTILSSFVKKCIDR